DLAPDGDAPRDGERMPCAHAPVKTRSGSARQDRAHRRQETPCAARTYSAASVPTSFQLGSRAVTSREKVQTSVTSVTLSALPSTILPSLSRVAETICDTKRTTICALRPFNSAPVSSA